MKEREKKTVWYFSHHSTPPELGQFTRHYNFGKKLIESGYDVKIFAGSVPHNTDVQLINGKEKYITYEKSNVPYIFVKTCLYNKSGLKRLKAMIEYTTRLFSVTKKIEKISNKPDVIIASSPHLLTCIAGIMIAKRYKIKCITEIRDLWPASIVEYSSKIKNSNLIIKLLYSVEKWIYVKSDKIIFTSEGGYDYIKEKNMSKLIPKNKVFHINNGVDILRFRHLMAKPNEHIKYEESKFIVSYTGSIRKVNDVSFILDTAKIITDDRVHINIWGSGNEVEILKERVKKENINNITFKGTVSKDQIPRILNLSNLNLLHNKTSNLIKYGLSQNKIFEYLASERPIISTLNAKYDFIEKNGCGVYLLEQEPELLANKIIYFLNLEEGKYKEYCYNARKTAEQYDFYELTKKLINLIEV